MDGLRLRLHVAHQQTESLRDIISAFIKVHAPRFTPEFDHKTGWVILRMHTGFVSDPMWGVLAGGILHDLRATLDNLTWNVALLSPYWQQRIKWRNPPTPRIQFPIWLLGDSKKRDNKGNPIPTYKVPGLTAQLSGILKKHQAFFERQQPYKRGNGRRADPLWILKEMNDADKHRVIHFTALAVVMGSFGLSDRDRHLVREFRSTAPMGDFVDGTEVARFLPVDPSKGAVQVEFNITFQVCFDESCGPGKGLSVIKALRAMHARVATIVESFAPLFP